MEYNRIYDPFNQKPVEYYDSKANKDMDERKVSSSQQENGNLQPQTLRQLDQVCADRELLRPLQARVLRAVGHRRVRRRAGLETYPPEQQTPHAQSIPVALLYRQSLGARPGVRQRRRPEQVGARRRAELLRRGHLVESRQRRDGAKDQQ